MSTKPVGGKVLTVALNREEREQLLALVVAARDAERRNTVGWRYWEKLRVKLTY